MQEHHIDVDRYRRPKHQVETLFYHRWSPRAMSGESLSGAELGTDAPAGREMQAA